MTIESASAPEHNTPVTLEASTGQFTQPQLTLLQGGLVETPLQTAVDANAAYELVAPDNSVSYSVMAARAVMNRAHNDWQTRSFPRLVAATREPRGRII